jgi:hypothetical protein
MQPDRFRSRRRPVAAGRARCQLDTEDAEGGGVVLDAGHLRSGCGVVCGYGYLGR